MKDSGSNPGRDTNQTCAGDLLSIRKQAKTAVCTFTNILFSVSLINYKGVFLSCCITALYMTKKQVFVSLYGNKPPQDPCL